MPSHLAPPRGVLGYAAAFRLSASNLRTETLANRNRYCPRIGRHILFLCLDHLRKKTVRKEDAPVAKDADGGEYDLLDQVADGRAGANPERDLMRRQLGARIAGALEKLTPRERMVFELKHYHGMKLRTVGEILHTTEETAKNTLFRATQKLRGALGDMR